jgi:hypothetical protein
MHPVQRDVVAESWTIGLGSPKADCSFAWSWPAGLQLNHTQPRSAHLAVKSRFNDPLGPNSI